MTQIDLQETPIFILHIFGSELVKETGGQILFAVEQRPTLAEDGKFHLDLVLVVPELNDYRYRLLTLDHPPSLYPLNIVDNLDGKTYQVANSKALRTRFKLGLHSQTMQAVIGGLLAQLLATRQLQNITR